MKKKSASASVLFILFLFQPLYSIDCPALKKYDQEYTCKVSLPIGGIGIGTVSPGGRSNLQDWEIMNKPAKGFNPGSGKNLSIYKFQQNGTNLPM